MSALLRSGGRARQVSRDRSSTGWTGRSGSDRKVPASMCVGRAAVAVAVAAAGAVFVAAPAAQAAAVSGPVITAYAGNGTYNPPTPGPATSSALHHPYQEALDPAGDLFFADSFNEVVVKVTPAGVLSIVAGNGSGSYAPPTPGPATSTPLGDPSGVALDAAGDLYISNPDSSSVVKVTPGGILSVYAGDGGGGVPIPGPATSSPLTSPYGLAVDGAGNLYIGSGALAGFVTRVSPAGILSVVAGDGEAGAPVPGPATRSPLDGPIGVGAAGDGTLYIADFYNNVIERVSPAGILSVVTGRGPGHPGRPTPGPAAASALNGPLGVSVTPTGNLDIADNGNHDVEQVTPAGVLSVLAGTGRRGTPHYGYPATTSNLGAVVSAVTSAAGVLYICDSGNDIIERVGHTIPTAPTALTATGGDTTASLSFTPGDPGTSPIHRYQVSLDGGTTWAGLPTATGAGGTRTAHLAGLANGRTYPVRVRAVNAAGAGPGSDPAPVTPTPRVAPRPSIAAARAAVLTHPRLPVVCSVSTGQLRSCAVTLTARVGGHLVVVGRGHAGTTVGTRRVTVTTVLTPAGRILVSRLGGVGVIASAAITTHHSVTVLQTRRGVHLQAAAVPAGEVRFAPASARLTGADVGVLTLLRHHLGGVHRVVCAGYTDTVGDDPYNQRLGLARARATCGFLTAGRPLEAVAVSFGETHPAATNATPAGRAANRRVLIAVEY